MVTKVDTRQLLIEAVKERCSENAYLCYFCRKCTSGCPVSEHMDLTPSEVMRSLQLGFDEQVLTSRTIWLCAHCETCFTRCPQEIDIPTMMDVLTGISRERGIRPAIPEVALINQLAMSWIRRMGRMYELGIMAERNLRSLQPFRDLSLGLKMFTLGKLKLMPTFVRYKAPRVGAHEGVSAGPHPSPLPEGRGAVGALRVAYFPGCSQESSAIEYDMSIRAAAQALSLELAEPEGWLCCGSGMGHVMPPTEAATWPMKTLALAAAQGGTTLTMGCAACYSRFQRGIHAVEHDPEVRAAVEKATKCAYQQQIKVQHLLDTFVDEVGLEAIGRRVTRPLEGLRVVSYYGCLLTRPPEVTQAVHVENPQKMDRLLRRLGAEGLDWSYKTECCGASLMLTEKSAALGLADRLLQEARAVGAETIAVACPFCHGNLDQHQGEMAVVLGHRHDMPIFYFTQLMGLAFGLSSAALGFSRHFAKPDALLQRLGM